MKILFKQSRIALLCIIMAACSFAQAANKAFTLTPEKVISGEPLLIEYNSDSTILKGEKDIKAIIYYWQDYSWHAHDLTLQQKGSIWSATVNIPQNAGLLTCKFKAGKKIDKGARESGYAWFILKPGNKPAPSSYIGWGLLRGVSTQDYSIPGYITDSTNYIGNDVVRFWYNQEMMYCPTEYKKVYYYASKTLAIMQPDKVNPGIVKTVKDVIKADSLGDLSEGDLMKCIEVVRNYMKDDSLANKLERRALAKYPDGTLARDKELYRLFRVADNNQKETELAAFLKRFPTSTFENVHTEETWLYYGKIFQSVIYNQIIKHNNYALLTQYIHDSPYEMLATYFWHIVQIPYKNKLMTADKLRAHADLIMNEIFNRPQRIDQMVYSPSEWTEKNYVDRKDALLAYAKILDETGSSDKAMKWAQIIEPYFENKSSEFADFYISLLTKFGQSDKIVPLVKACVHENAASPQMLDILKKDYIAQKGSEAGFDDYLNSMKNQTEVAAEREALKNSLIKQPIKLFTVNRLNGGSVNMAAMKGKIIVLDFWATWCAPCKAAMPGMQLAVNKYKDDKNVAFYFIATMETDPKYKEKLRAFIKEKNYNFEVLLDGMTNGKLPNEEVYENYAKTFHFSGIPQKMIIDGEGNLRWLSTGYAGRPSALADEISYIIELLKKEQQAK